MRAPVGNAVAPVVSPTSHAKHDQFNAQVTAADSFQSVTTLVAVGPC